MVSVGKYQKITKIRNKIFKIIFFIQRNFVYTERFYSFFLDCDEKVMDSLIWGQSKHLLEKKNLLDLILNAIFTI